MALTTFGGSGSGSETAEERCIKDGLITHSGDDFADAGSALGSRDSAATTASTLEIAPYDFRPSSTGSGGNGPAITTDGLALDFGERVDYGGVDGYRTNVTMEFDFRFDSTVAGTEAGLLIGWEDDNLDQCRVFVGGTGELNVAGGGVFIVYDGQDSDNDWVYDNTSVHTVRMEKAGDTFELFIDDQTLGTGTQAFSLVNPRFFIENNGADPSLVYVTRWVIY